MDAAQPMTTSTLGEAKYINFPSLPADAKHPDGSVALNRYSSTITRGHDFPGARVC
jgi:dihydroxy-acid dehydratase